ncbi:MAG: hypothetical protein FWD93_06570 [Coriobacteriia bacterium]|nr:hypothetical protein [Coriobacteriia bacterium]
MLGDLIKKYSWLLLIPLIAIGIYLRIPPTAPIPFIRSAPYVQLEQSDEMRLRAVEELRHFRINGITSSNNWIELSDGRLSVTGFVERCELDSDMTWFSLFVSEEVSGGRLIFAGQE